MPSAQTKKRATIAHVSLDGAEMVTIAKILTSAGKEQTRAIRCMPLAKIRMDLSHASARVVTLAMGQCARKQTSALL